METKICSDCKRTLPISNFYIIKSKDGKYTHLNIRCRECGKIRKQKYYIANKEKILLNLKQSYISNKDKIKEYNKKYHELNKEEIKKQRKESNDILKENKLWTGAKLRAKKRNLPFDLEIEDLIIPDVCPVLGIPIIRDYHFTESRRGTSPNSPSVDRIDNSKGYTKDNTRVISHRANSLKRDASIEEMEKILEYMKKSIKK